MNNNPGFANYHVFATYLVPVTPYGYWIYRKKKNVATTAMHDFFFAEGSLTWWAVAVSLTASNTWRTKSIQCLGVDYRI
jgi:SSS family solute:Na+ symporter